MSAIILIAVIALSGVVCGFDPERRFDFPKAVLWVVIDVVIASGLLLTWISIITNTPLMAYASRGIGSYFFLLFMYAFCNGLILYWIHRFIERHHNIPDRVLTLMEYVIQWSLIYIAIYQVMFDSTFPKEAVEKLMDIEIVTSQDVAMVILPALISTWVAVIFYKMHRKSL